ncbi:SDR family NAD(P)-dependent oxidoreductase [Paenibacillus albiflavus]|uniref:SDR family NAD(P)-dependent oxidoreductase n=1 Tax=Paenibacillus albiflavus TaxID=2545760 RepID=A0A4R4ECF3_9BACL|nr:SDR family NAD(P)-dependent oxidoreductase [Paenibacillus albiflavus]TCZ76650.1 SDR family NAD(P)-dependent oxidoreductase [Paenibacillus albiflavus]
MTDRIVVITGANSGIGKAAAYKFATQGYCVVMACRNMEISEAVQHQIIASSNNTNVDLMKLDVSSFTSIRAFCSAFTNKYPHLDILIHNAAYLNHGEKEYKLSPEHIEMSFATNAFGPMLMTRLLADHLERSPDPRVLNACTTNIKNFFDPKRKIDFDNLRGEFRGMRRHSTYKMYGDSKMALLMLTFKMAEQLKSRGIKVNALQINRVKLSKETIHKLSPFWKVLALAQNITNPLPSIMADNYYQICTSDEFSQVTGQLINHKLEIVQPSVSEKGFAQLKNIFGSATYPQYATDKHNIEKIWSIGINAHKE